MVQNERAKVLRVRRRFVGQHVHHFLRASEVEVRFASELLDKKMSLATQSSTFINRFWRPGRGPDTLWLWVRVESPFGQVMMSNRGIVTVTATWPAYQIDRRSVEFEMKS